MTKPSIEQVSESRCFDGRQIVYKHVGPITSEALEARIIPAIRAARAR